MHCHTITIDHEAYKAVGAVPSLIEYAKASTSSSPASDWHAMYLQLNAQHAIDTVGYRWEQGHAESIVLALNVRCEALLVASPLMASSSVSGAEKARLLKLELGIDPARPLMAALGERNQCLVCLESDGEFELIIPHSMLADCVGAQRALYRFRPNAFLATATYRREDAAEWTPLPASGRLEPNEPPAWLRDMLPTH